GGVVIARAFEEAGVGTLVIRWRCAREQTGSSRLVIAGGVSANQALREQLRALGERLNATVYYPRPQLCTDNGAMVAYAGYCRLSAGEQVALDFSPTSRWPIETLREPAA